jgi:prepilin-type N-terminal cleavage/methylation domain-containing protein
MKNIYKPNRAFTLIELIVVIAMIAILAVCMLPALALARPKVQHLTCSNNLKQVGVAFRTWAIAHNGYMPMTLASAMGGNSDTDVGVRSVQATQVASRGVSKMFLTMSNELNTPKVLFCPAEYESSQRQPATSFAPRNVGTNNAVPYTNDLNVSYFIGVDASETNPRMFLTGDHNLGGNGNPPTTPYLAAVSTGTPFVSLGTNFTANQGPAWLDNMHAQHGNVGLADGSVEWFNRSELQAALKSSGDRGRTAGVFANGAGTVGTATALTRTTWLLSRAVPWRESVHGTVDQRKARQNKNPARRIRLHSCTYQRMRSRYLHARNRSADTPNRRDRVRT